MQSLKNVSIKVFVIVLLLLITSCKEAIILHSVTVESNGSIIQTIQVPDGQSLGISLEPPEAPVGKEFAFWSVDGINPYDFSSPVVSDIVIKAVWNIAKCKVSFINDYTVVDLYVEYNSILQESDCPSFEDEEEREFLFWSEDGSTEYDFHKTITADLILYSTSKRFSFNFTRSEAFVLFSF